MFLSRSPSLRACVEAKKKKGKEGVERISLCCCMPLLFAPHVWELLLACSSLRSSRVDISFVPSSLCCYSVNPPGGRIAASALPPPDWVRGEETLCGGRCKSQWGFRKYSHTCMSTHLSTHTKTPRCETNRLLVLLNVDELGQAAYSMS